MAWNKPFLRTLAATVWMWAATVTATAQISLSPTIVFLPEAEPIGRLTLRNTGTMPQEVSLAPIFGYPISDADGRLRIEYEDSVTEAASSLIPHLRVYPRRFVLEPGGLQNVRLEVSGLEERPHGLYWTRLHITTSEVTPDVETSVQDGIGTRVSYRVRQDIGVHYLHGEVRTELDVSSVEAEKTEGDGRTDLVMHMRMTSGGNSPYIGSLQVRLVDSAGALVRTGEWLFSVYGERYWPQGLDVTGLPTGRYRLDMIFQTQRGDVASANLPNSQPLVRTLTLEL